MCTNRREVCVSILVKLCLIRRPSAGRPIQDGTFLLLLNAHHEPVPFVLPGLRNVEWQLVVDTAREPAFARSGEAYGSAAAYDLRDRSIVLLQLKAGSTRALKRTRRGAADT